MELQEVIRSTGTCRYYRRDPIPDNVLARVLEAARFAPSGGNRQPVRLIVVRDQAKRRQLRDWYVSRWSVYMEAIERRELRVVARAQHVKHTEHFATHLDQVPVLIVVCAIIADLYVTDRELGRVSVVGGASIYPAVQNLLLASREEGLGTCLTTLLCWDEPKVKDLLGIPDEAATVAMIPLGYPVKPLPSRLRRRPLREIAFLDTYGEPLP